MSTATDCSQTQLGFDGGELFHCELEIFLGMGGRDLGANARLALGDHGEGETDHIDSAFQHGLGELLRQGGIAQHDRDDRMPAGKNVESQTFHSLAKEAGVFLESIPQLSGIGKHVEGLDGPGDDGRGESVGKQVGARTLPEEIDDLLTSAGIATARSSEGFSKGAGEDVDSLDDIVMFVRAASLFAHEADGVRVIDHYQGVVFLREITNGLEIGNVAIHREHTIGGNESDLRILRFLQFRFEVRHVVVAVAESLRFAESHPVDDARVIQFIGDDGIIRGEQGLEESAIGIEAGGIEDGIVSSKKGAELFFQLFVGRLRAADKADGRQSVSPFVQSRVRGGDDVGVLRQSQIVVGAHIEHRFTSGHGDARALGGGDHAFAFEQAGVTDFIELRVELLFECSEHVL